MKIVIMPQRLFETVAFTSFDFTDQIVAHCNIRLHYNV